jgi:hypothetical protein
VQVREDLLSLVFQFSSWAKWRQARYNCVAILSGSLCNRPPAVLRTPSSRAFSGEMLEKALTTTETLGIVWLYGTKQGAW